MKRVNHIGSLLTVLVVSILLTSILYRSVLSFSAFQPVKETVVLKKKTDSPTALDTQLLYEEREGEDETESFCADDESKAGRFFIRLIEVRFSDKSIQVHSNAYTSRICCDVFQTPRYLLHRSILI